MKNVFTFFIIFYGFSINLNGQCAVCPSGSIIVTGSTGITDQNNANDYCVEGSWTGIIGNVAGGSTITICDNATWIMTGNVTVQTNIDIVNYGVITDNGSDHKLFFQGQAAFENKLSGSINIGAFENQDAGFINDGSLTADDIYLHGNVVNNGSITATADCGGNASTTCGFFVGDKSSPLENYGTFNFIDGVIKDDVIGGNGTFESTGTLIIENNNGFTDNNFKVNNLTFQNMQNVSQGDFTIGGVLNCNNVNLTATACFTDTGSYGSSCSGSSDLVIQCSILPVVLKKFTYRKHNQSLSLLWEIISEVNSSHYEVLQSTDGKNFESIARINATNQGFYQYDIEELKTAEYYYQLKSVDLDGKEEIIGNTLFIKNEITTLSISPNPATKERGITIDNMDRSNGTLTVYDLNGQRIITLSFSNQEKIDVDLSSIQKSGLYIVEVSSQNSTTTEKIYVY